MEKGPEAMRLEGNMPGTLRIAYLFNHPFFLGGGEISFLELIKNIDRKHIDPVVLVPGEGEIADRLERMGIAPHICPLPPLRRILKGEPFFSMARLAGILRENAVRILHVNGSRACFYGGLSGRILGIPILWHVRETIEDVFFYDGFLAFLAREIVCVSGAVRVKRFQKFPAPLRKKIRVVHNGVDTLNFHADPAAGKRVREELGLEGGILFGMVGSILPLKGQDFFLRGLAAARRKMPGLRACALIVGRPLDAAYDKMIHRLVSETGLERAVRFLPYSNRVRDVFSALDVFVLLSEREGFSRSLLEAMSVGLPVLASKIPEIEEAVTHGKNALLVDRGSVDELALAITTLCTDKRLRDGMAKENRARAEREFDLRSHARSIETIYRSMLSKSR